MLSFLAFYYPKDRERMGELWEIGENGGLCDIKQRIGKHSIP